jgi:hypothetical protein
LTSKNPPKFKLAGFISVALKNMLISTCASEFILNGKQYMYISWHSLPEPETISSFRHMHTHTHRANERMNERASEEKWQESLKRLRQSTISPSLLLARRSLRLYHRVCVCVYSPSSIRIAPRTHQLSSTMRIFF